MDKVGPRWAYSSINYAAAVALIVIMLWGTNLVVLFVAGFFFGAALSSSAVCFSSATTMYLGPKNFAQIYGLVFLGKPIFDAIGVPLLAAISGSCSWMERRVYHRCDIRSRLCNRMLFAKKNKQLAAMEEEAAKELAAKSEAE